jgi:squalene-hopene/tetraprenyl-beta-curcumene cyclase
LGLGAAGLYGPVTGIQAHPIQAAEGGGAVAQEAAAGLPVLADDLRQVRSVSVGNGLRFLDAQQAPDGSFAGHAGTGPSSLAVAAMLRQGRTVSHPAVAKGVQFLLSNIREDGGVYAEGSLHKNYETSLAIMALALIDDGKTYAKEIEAATKLIRQMQWGPNQGKGPEDMTYGGAGYGRHGRPDLSNTSFMIDALKAAGATADDPDVQAALAFVSRCQNLESEFNKTEFATMGPKDGGFYYTAAAGGQSMAGEAPGGGLRSYGSMTYAGLKSMIYAGVSKEDPRVQAAMSFLKKNYDVNANPGMGSQGLYYYYQMFSKAFQAIGEPTFTDADGKVHDWRADLIGTLSKRQQANGSWYNVDSDRWMEGDAILVTSYALLALSYTE